MIGVKIQTDIPEQIRSIQQASIVEDNVHNGKKGASQMIAASHFITAEQLFKSSGGRFSQVSLIVRENGFCCFRQGKKKSLVCC